MSTAAQILANKLNAQHSTGPVTPEGKARVSQNATKLGLFSTSGFVHPEEREIFDDFTRGYMAELSPETLLEQTLAREIVHAAWRLRRCAEIECAMPDVADDEELDRIQASIDRARTTAQRALHRSLAELRRVQTENAAALLMKRVEAVERHSAKQTQSRPAPAASIARNAPCPCRSGEKYKRCCGKNAPPVLGATAAPCGTGASACANLNNAERR